MDKQVFIEYNVLYGRTMLRAAGSGQRATSEKYAARYYLLNLELRT